MEQGAKSLLRILLVALLIGIAVIACHSKYRQAFFAILNGEPASSPIWTSNATYYPDIDIPGAPSLDIIDDVEVAPEDLRPDVAP